MRIKLDVSLDPTLGCGQAHRWKKENGSWTGVLGNEVIRMKETDRFIEIDGCCSESKILSYLRSVESVCRTFGKEIAPGRYTFPNPKEILDCRDKICECRLGFRQDRFVALAENVESGNIDLGAIAELDYRKTVECLQKINGVGPKVADCVALFAFDHLEAFPVDTRIAQIMEKRFGVTGNYKTVSGFGMNLFGKYAGYAQEYLYHSDYIV